MGLLERIDEDLKSSLKARDALKTSVIRMLKAGIKNREIEKRGSLEDGEVHAVISTMIKQRKDSVEQYGKAGRTDLADKEEEEIKILMEYLPAQLSEEELEGIIREAISEAGAASPGDMGKVMKILMPRVKGKADGKLVNQKVKEMLGG